MMKTVIGDMHFFTFRTLLLIFLITILGGLTTLGIISYHNDQTFKNSNFRVKYTHQVIYQALLVADQSKAIQLEAGGYIIANDTASLSLYLQYKTQLKNNLGKLFNLTKDNPSQQQRVQLLTSVINRLLNFTDQSVQTKRNTGFTNQNLIDNLNERKLLRNEVEVLIDQIRIEENRLLKLREDENAQSISSAYRFFAISLFLILLFLFTAFILIIYHFQKRLKAEKKVEDSEKMFRMLVNNIKDLAIFMIDAKGCILNWYQGASNLKGYTNEEVIGKPISIFYPKEDIEKGEPEYNLLMAAQHGSFETEGWRVRKDKTLFWADVLITAIYDENGELQGFTKVTRDFTMHKKAEDESRQALEKEKELHEMKSNFVSIASHEFRTPLSTILSSAALLEKYRTTETQEKRDRHIQRIRSSVCELINILEEFLSLEKIEEGKVENKQKVFSLKDMGDKITTELSPILKPGQKIVPIHIGEEQVNLDPSFIHHILTNLVTNAIKYSPADTTITIQTINERNTIKLIIKDQGIGIPLSDQRHLFERFYRASNAGTVQGTGLGLHIVKRYVDLMGGNIEVFSKPGSGSVFTVTLTTASSVVLEK